MERKRNRKGFTLAELLIVVAIIAVLVAIAIPIFSSQLEKSREATDNANVRSAYAEVITEFLSDDTKSYSMTVQAKQQKSGWQNSANGKITIQKSGVETPLSFSAKTNGSSYNISITKNGSISIN